MKIKAKTLVLKGATNYPTWNRKISSLMNSLRIAVVVIEGVIPRTNVTEKELEVFSLLQQDGLMILNMNVEEKILETISSEDPHLIWKHLRSMFYRDSPYNCCVQMHNVHALFSKVDVTKPLTEHIERFEAEYTKLLNLLKNSANPDYSQDLVKALNKDSIRKAMLLSALVPHNPMLVDNIMNSIHLTYEDSKNRLIVTAASQTKEEFVVPGNAGKEEKAMMVDTAENSLATCISHPNKVTKRPLPHPRIDQHAPIATRLGIRHLNVGLKKRTTRKRKRKRVKIKIKPLFLVLVLATPRTCVFL